MRLDAFSLNVDLADRTDQLEINFRQTKLMFVSANKIKQDILLDLDLLYIMKKEK